MSEPERFSWLCHAYVGRGAASPAGVLDTEWVAVFRETEPDGTTQFCVEHLDQRFGEIAGDEPFPTEAAARAHAEGLYDLTPQDWRAGEPKAVQEDAPPAS